MSTDRRRAYKETDAVIADVHGVRDGSATAGAEPYLLYLGKATNNAIMGRSVQPLGALGPIRHDTALLLTLRREANLIEPRGLNTSCARHLRSGDQDCGTEQ